MVPGVLLTRDSIDLHESVARKTNRNTYIMSSSPQKRHPFFSVTQRIWDNFEEEQTKPTKGISYSANSAILFGRTIDGIGTVRDWKIYGRSVDKTLWTQLSAD